MGMGRGPGDGRRRKGGNKKGKQKRSKCDMLLCQYPMMNVRRWYVSHTYTNKNNDNQQYLQQLSCRPAHSTLSLDLGGDSEGLSHTHLALWVHSRSVPGWNGRSPREECSCESQEKLFECLLAHIISKKQHNYWKHQTQSWPISACIPTLLDHK